MDLRIIDGIPQLGPPVLPWTRPDDLECPKCGARNHTSFALHYCKGNMPPDATVRNPNGDEVGKVELACGGVTEEHLHVHCRLCHFDRLMQTKEGADNQAREKLRAHNLHSADELPRLVSSFERNAQEGR